MKTGLVLYLIGVTSRIECKLCKWVFVFLAYRRPLLVSSRIFRKMLGMFYQQHVVCIGGGILFSVIFGIVE